MPNVPCIISSASRSHIRRRFFTGFFQAKTVENNATLQMYLAACKACSVSKEIQLGKKVHNDSSISNISSHLHVLNSLINMYAKCGCITHAKEIFDGMIQRDVVTWNALILGYVVNGEPMEALELLSQAFKTSFVDSRTYVSAFMACSSMAEKEESRLMDGKLVKVNSLQTGMFLHSNARELNYHEDVYVAGTLVDMYSKCGSMEDARSVFESMVSPNVVPWTALILGYAENGQGEVALDLFQRMQQEGCEPNARTFVAALASCTSLRLKENGKQGGKAENSKCLKIGTELHGQARKRRLDSELFVASSLIDMYSKCGNVTEAREVFNGMKKHDVVSWTSMILGYAENGNGKEALELFEQMQAKRCKPNCQTFLAALQACANLLRSATGEAESKVECLERVMSIHSQAVQRDIIMENALLDLYSKCGSVFDARALFDRMEYHNVVSWTALILGYAENEESDLALELFASIRSSGRCQPDAHLYVAALVACSSSANFRTGWLLHREIHRFGLESNEIIANCLVDFYGRCGKIENAQRVFDWMASKDLVAWTSLLAGFSRVGCTSRMFHLFSEMDEAGVHANAVTILSLLTACSHAGLVEKGKKLLQMMRCKYRLKPEIEHYHCMIDMLGRAGHLDEALEMVRGMPYEANVITWTTLLGACEKWKNVELGKVAFKSLMALNDKLPAAYSLMANLYGSVGMLQEQAQVERDARVKKTCTVIPVGDKLNVHSAFLHFEPELLFGVNSGLR